MDNKFDIDCPTINFKPRKSYDLDVDKISNLEDIGIILRAMQLAVYEDYNNFDEIKHLLKEKSVE